MVAPEEFLNVQVSPDLITYYRRKERAKLQSLALDNLDVAQANCPELVSLSGRLGMLNIALTKELAKKRISGHAVAALISAATRAVYKAEILALRAREANAKSPDHGDSEKECILQELERRSILYQRVDAEGERFAKLAGPKF